MRQIAGNLLKLGDDVDCAQILPQQYHTITDAAELAKHVLEGLDQALPAKIKRGNVLVAGSRFGRGPEPTPATLALKAAGVRCIVAKSFGRIFFRSAINRGLLAIVADIVDKVDDGDDIVVDLEQGKITLSGFEADFPPYPEFVCKIVQTGDLITAVKKELGKK